MIFQENYNKTAAEDGFSAAVLCTGVRKEISRYAAHTKRGG